MVVGSAGSTTVARFDREKDAELAVSAVNAHHALVEALGQGAARLDNLLEAMKLPLPLGLHLEGIRGTLPDIANELRQAVSRAKGGGQ